MDSMIHIDVTYSKWKDMRTFLGGTANSYYIQTPTKYTLVLVDLSRKFVTLSHLHITDPQLQESIADFETNLKTTSISQPTIDDCVAAAIIG